MSFRALEVSKNHAFVAPHKDGTAASVSDADFQGTPPDGVVVVANNGLAIRVNGAWETVAYV